MLRTDSWGVVVATSALAALACAGPPRHTAEPYASDPEAAAALEARAAAYCSALYPSEDQQPTKPFVTDGCSRWFDRDWNLACCIDHDISYWCGGTRDQRTEADVELGKCVAEKTRRPVGFGMRLGVGFGGHPFLPTSYRWGYGHAYRAWYPSTKEQRAR